MRALITKSLSYVYVASAVAVRSAYASGAPHSIGAISPLLDLLLLKLYSLGVAPLWASWHPFARRSAGFLCWGIPLRAGLACPQLGVWPQPGRYIGSMIYGFLAGQWRFITPARCFGLEVIAKCAFFRNAPLIRCPNKWWRGCYWEMLRHWRFEFYAKCPLVPRQVPLQC